MQHLCRIARWLAAQRADAKAARAERQRRVWARDPLSHPALSRMTPHQLADLPLERNLFVEEPAAKPVAAAVASRGDRRRSHRAGAYPAGQGCQA